MKLQVFIAIGLVLLTSAQAWACSCLLWEGGNVSDLYADKANVSLWVLPQKAVLKEQGLEWDEFYVSYELRVLESFGQITDKQITAISSVEDGASCGIQLDLGNPHFLTMTQQENGDYGISACHPELPYSLVRAYLEKGVDSYIPGIHECRDDNDEIKKTEACSVWNATYYSDRYGSEDSLIYIKQLRNEPKKKRAWWHFKKD